jgi:hypothetical protein
MWEYIYVNKNIYFHSYVINTHSFGSKPACDLQSLINDDVNET